MELHENHEGEGGTEFSDAEEREEKRVEEAEKDPEVLANPTEVREGAVSGGDPANPTSTPQTGNSGEASDGGSLPGNSGEAGAGQNP